MILTGIPWYAFNLISSHFDCVSLLISIAVSLNADIGHSMDRMSSNLNGRGFQAVVCLLFHKATTTVCSIPPENAIAASQRLFLCVGSCSRISYSYCISCFHLPPDFLPVEGVFVPLIVLISHAFYWLKPAATGFKLAFDKKSFEIQRPRAFIVILGSLPVRLTF